MIPSVRIGVQLQPQHAEYTDRRRLADPAAEVGGLAGRARLIAAGACDAAPVRRPDFAAAPATGRIEFAP